MRSGGTGFTVTVFASTAVPAERWMEWIGRPGGSAESERTPSASRLQRFNLEDGRVTKEDRVEEEDVIGFLGSDGVLYCSEACALSRGTLTGYEVDPDEYEGLVESESLSRGGLCPACGAEFAVPWPEREPN
jgi:hypothetical protein